MGRNSGDYVLYPKNIGDGLYAATNPSGTNPFVTQSVLDSAVGLNNELSEILANGNTTDGNDILVSTGDSITGVAELTLTATTSATLDAATTVGITAGTTMNLYASGAIFISTDAGVSATPLVNLDPVAGTGTLYANVGAYISSDGLVSVTSATTTTVSATTIVGITGGTGVTATATTGNILMTATTGDIGFTSTVADINLSAGDNIGLTAVSTTLNTRETIWTSQAAGATALVDAFKLYSADIAAGNAAPHFETENGDIVKLFRGATIADAAGGATIDAEARTAINALLARMRVTGGNGLIAD